MRVNSARDELVKKKKKKNLARGFIKAIEDL